MPEIVNKILRNKKEIMGKMDRLHILLLLVPSTELTKQLDYIEEFYITTLEFLDNNQDNNESVVINRLTNDYDTIMNVLGDIKEELSKRVKLVSLLYIETLKGEILTYFYTTLEEMISQVASVTYLPNYIKEFEQTAIQEFLNKVLEYVNTYAGANEKRLLPLKYLEEAGTKKITDVQGFTDLHKNISFTLKYITCSDYEQERTIKEAFWKMELYYLIMITLG